MSEQSRSSAEIFDSVTWDYDPEHEDPSPLVPTERYFRDFPWEPDDLRPDSARAVDQRPSADPTADVRKDPAQPTEPPDS